MWKFWFLTLNLAVAAWVLFDARDRAGRLKWAAGVFGFTIAALPAYLARTGRGRLGCAAAAAVYSAAVLAGMPFGVFETLMKRSPFMKYDQAGQQVVWAPAKPGGRWEGKRILAVGTSITAGAAAKFRDGFIDQAVRWHNAVLDNVGEGSSGIVWDGLRERSLGATRAELIKSGFDGGQSYESRILGHLADLVLFDHGFNDRSYPMGTIDDQTPATFYGAFNRVIKALLAEQPNVQLVFITPPSLYTPAGEGRQQGTAAAREAIIAIAKRYNGTVLDMTSLAGFDSTECALEAFPDTYHPSPAAHSRMAGVLYRFLADLEPVKFGADAANRRHGFASEVGGLSPGRVLAVAAD